MTISNNTPQIDCISWSGLHIQFGGNSYAIDDGYTNKPYAIWRPSISYNTLVVYDELPTDFTANDCLVFLNKNGISTLVPGCTILDGDLIVPGSITAKAMAAQCITADKLYAGLISSGVIEVNALGALTIAAQAILAEHIHAATITGDRLVMDAITAREIAGKTITANEILARTITTAELDVGSVKAINIDAGAVVTEKLDAKAVTAEKIDVEDLFADTIFTKKLQVSAVPSGDTPPALPEAGQLWRNTDVIPNELLACTGNGTDNTVRRYATSKEAAIVTVADLDGTDLDLDVTVKTRAKQTVTTQSANLCPPTSSAKWLLSNGAYKDAEGYIVLPNANSNAEILIHLNAPSYGNMMMGATYQSDNAAAKANWNVYYLDSNLQGLSPSGNGAASALGGTTPVWRHDAWWDDGGPYAIARGNSSYVRWCIQREATYAPYPYRFKDPYFGLTVDTTAPIPFVPQSPSPEYPAPITPAIATGGNANIKRCGKNLLDYTKAYDGPGTTVSFVENGFIETGTYHIYIPFNPPLPPGTYIASWDYEHISGSQNDIAWYFLHDDNTIDWNQANIYEPRIMTKPVKALIPYIGFGEQGSGKITNFQVEEGTVATDYEPYSGNDYALPVQQAMYGVTGAEDERGSDGHETHKTAYYSFTGSESIAGYSENGATVRAGFYLGNLALPVAVAGGYGISSHFVNAYSWSIEPPHFYTEDNLVWLFIPRAMLSAVTDAAISAWLTAQAAAGTPVQIVYQIAPPSTVANASTPITGVDGTNTVTSDGAAVLVGYTGSGWAKVGDTNTVSADRAAELAKITEAITTGDDGLTISGIGGKYKNVMGPVGYELWESGIVVLSINGQLVAVPRIKVANEIQIGISTYLFSNADGSGGIK